jgi:phosphoglycolate phosphatase-like HAD superfamily hydrolase
MKEFTNKTVILWDFDGVILFSDDIRIKGFREVLDVYPKAQVEQLLAFHKQNGGLSRYVKFRHFYEEIRGETISEDFIIQCANRFSAIMKKELASQKRLNQEVVTFIKKNSTKYRMHIVSGSDGEELNYLCKELGIASYFYSIDGSPVPKINLVQKVIAGNNYSKDHVCLIGDSKNDWEAANQNGIDFLGYNNKELKDLGKNYIEKFI